MRITFGSGYESAMVDLNQAAEALQLAQQQVSSGKRLQLPSDDPSAMAASIRERGEIATIDQYTGAADSVDSRVSVIDTVFSDLIRQLTTARASAAGAIGSVQSEAQREATARDLEGLRDAIFSDMNTVFRGTYVFAGSDSLGIPYTKNPDGSVSAYQGDDGQVRVDIDRNRSIATTYSGRQVLQGDADEDLFTSMQRLIAAVRTGDQAGILEGQTRLSEAFDRVVAMQSGVGADLKAVEDQQARLSAMKLANKERLSKDEDANPVEAITEMKRADTVYQYSLGAIASRTRLSLLDYLK